MARRRCQPPSPAPIAGTLTLVLAGALALGMALGTGPGAAARAAAAVDRVLVLKGERRLELLGDGAVIRSYRVALGRQPRGPKQVQGDGRTPEGVYRLDGFNAASRFHRAIHISYPDAADKVLAQRLGRSPGGGIMLHGLPRERPRWGAEHWMYNWTNGCIAVTDAEMDEIWRLVGPGTPIEIRP